MPKTMKFSTYAVLSSALTAAVIAYAYQTRIQFYNTVIFLVTSKFSVLVLGNMGIMMTLLLGRITKTVFLGQLRDVEVEILYDNSRYAITETCLALTIFREELTTRVLTLFTALLFSKSFHWLCQSRVEYVESDTVSRWTHLRLVTLMLTLLSVDVAFVSMCVYLWRGPSVLILFGFEYTILAVSILSTFIRYVLHIIDMQIEGNWPQKGSYLFFLEFVTEVVRFVSYLIFFMIIFTYYGMPLHIVRDLWMSYVNLKRRLIIFSKYRKLTANMNERFPDATEEELAACENTCIICRDVMESGKKLPCGHIFHLDCLRLWLQQQQTCPTCRADIPTDSPQDHARAANANRQPPREHARGFAAPQDARGAAEAAPRPDPVPPVPVDAGLPQNPMAQMDPNHFQAGIQHPPFPFPVPSGMFPVGMTPLLTVPPWLPPNFPRPHDLPFGPTPGGDIGGGAEIPQLLWYRVVGPQGVSVNADISTDSPVLRTIPRNEIILCLDRRTTDRGENRLRVPDGWISEQALELIGHPPPIPLPGMGNPPSPFQANPSGMPSPPVEGSPMPPPIPLMFNRIYSPFLSPNPPPNGAPPAFGESQSNNSGSAPATRPPPFIPLHPEYVDLSHSLSEVKQELARLSSVCVELRALVESGESRQGIAAMREDLAVLNSVCMDLKNAIEKNNSR